MSILSVSDCVCGGLVSILVISVSGLVHAGSDCAEGMLFGAGRTGAAGVYMTQISKKLVNDYQKVSGQGFFFLPNAQNVTNVCGHMTILSICA